MILIITNIRMFAHSVELRIEFPHFLIIYKMFCCLSSIYIIMQELRNSVSKILLVKYVWVCRDKS